VSRSALGPSQSPIQWVPGVLSFGVKRPRREDDHAPPSSREFKNAWSYTYTPQYVFVAWCSVKAQGQHISFECSVALNSDDYELLVSRAFECSGNSLLHYPRIYQDGMETLKSLSQDNRL